MTDKKEIFIPISWNIPDGSLGYANNIVIQHTDTEFILMFFQTLPPVILGTQEQQVAQLAEVKSVQAHCVASVIIPAGKMAEFIGIMQTNLEKFRQARMDEENEYFNFDAANPDQGADS